MTMQTEPRAGQVYDLAYRRYEGARLGPATRFLVIARYAVRMQWRQRAVKLFMLGALMCAGMGAILVGVSWVPSMALREAGDASPAGALQREGAARAVTWALNAQWVPVFLLVLVCGAPAVSNDLRAGAFQFHFARPVSAGHYLAGRMLSANLWAAVFLYATVGIFCIERLFVAPDVVPALKLMAIGVVAASARLATLGAVALGCSSLTRRAGLAQAMFAALVFGTGMFANIVAHESERPWIAALSVMGASKALAEQLLGEVTLRGSAAAAPAVASLVWAVGALALARWRLGSVEVVKG